MNALLKFLKEIFYVIIHLAWSTSQTSIERLKKEVWSVRVWIDRWQLSVFQAISGVLFTQRCYFVISFLFLKSTQAGAVSNMSHHTIFSWQFVIVAWFQSVNVRWNLGRQVCSFVIKQSCIGLNAGKGYKFRKPKAGFPWTLSVKNSSCKANTL